MNTSLGTLLMQTGGTASTEFNRTLSIEKVVSDSRLIGSDGVLFAALQGDNFDGHTFVSDIVKNGKCGAIIDNQAYMSPNTIYVPNVRKALYLLASKYRYDTLNKSKCVAITGSVGKTTTKEFASLVFSKAYSAYKSPGNQNSVTGLPMAILNAPENIEYLILELGMNKPGEIGRLSVLSRPDIAVITNIGWSHAEALGDREGIFKEKTDITLGMRDSGILIVNGDDDMLSKCKSVSDKRVISCTIESDKGDYYVSNIAHTPNGSNFDIHFKDEFVSAQINLMGNHNIMNALLAFAAGVTAGVSPDDAAKAISELPADMNRLKSYTANGINVFSDCYNAAPESMRAAIDVLASADGRKLAVLGDMLELGESSAALHYSVGKSAAHSALDILLCVGTESKNIAKGAIENGMNSERVYCFETQTEAADWLNHNLIKGDNVLFKASNRMKFPSLIKSIGL